MAWPGRTLQLCQEDVSLSVAGLLEVPISAADDAALQLRQVPAGKRPATTCSRRSRDRAASTQPQDRQTCCASCAVGRRGPPKRFLRRTRDRTTRRPTRHASHPTSHKDGRTVLGAVINHFDKNMGRMKYARLRRLDLDIATASSRAPSAAVSSAPDPMAPDALGTRTPRATGSAPLHRHQREQGRLRPLPRRLNPGELTMPSPRRPWPPRHAKWSTFAS